MDFTRRENVSGLISSAIINYLIVDNILRDRPFWEETYYIAALSQAIAVIDKSK